MKKNISIGKAAFQSSLSKWSHHPKEAENVLSGLDLNGYAFHTANEFNPWLIIDLQTSHVVTDIILHNRKGLEERCRGISVFISNDAIKWRKVYTTNDIFGGRYNNNPCSISLQKKPARFIRIEKNSFGSLQLSYVEVLGYTEEYIVSNDVVIKIDRKIISKKILDSLVENRYEVTELRYSLPEIKEGDNILELGAGIGFISSSVLKNNKVKSYTAIEANPLLIDVINKTHCLNDITDCEVINAVVTDSHQEKIPFYLRENFWGSSFSPGGHYSEAMVNTVSFSKLLLEKNITFLICDIEGAEHEILRTDHA